MDIAELCAPVERQNKGTWMTIHGPDGAETEIQFLVAGPDSDQQRKGRYITIDRFTKKADRQGIMSLEDSDAMSIDILARSVIEWKGLEDGGKPFECTHENIVKVLTGVPWLRGQVDVFASDRGPYYAKNAAEADAPVAAAPRKKARGG